MAAAAAATSFRHSTIRASFVIRAATFVIPHCVPSLRMLQRYRMTRASDGARSAWLAPVLACCLGCAGDSAPKDERPPLEGQSVRVLVVDDKALAAAVRDLEVAWKERSGAELSVMETTASAMLARQ